MRSPEMQSNQPIINGNGEGNGLSPRDIRLFVNKATQSPVPDIDYARAILPRVGELYKQLGVPKSDREKLTNALENMLYGGTAEEQVRASETLQSFEQTHNVLKETFPGGKRVW